MRYSAAASWICLAVVTALSIAFYRESWSHGDEGRAYLRLLVIASIGAAGVVAGLPAALKWRRSTWVPVVASSLPVLLFAWVWWKILQ